MQDNIMQAQAQPFIKLVQANMELLTRFSRSPEVMSPSTTDPSQYFQQATESATRMMQSGAMVELMQGMMKNYSEFLAELGQSGMMMMSEGQAAMLRQTQQATHSVIDAADTAGKRGRHAA